MTNAAAYRYDLGNAQTIYLSNQGILTTVTIHSGGVGQQQQSSQGLSTGQWTTPPKLYRLGGGYVATVFAEQTFYLSIQGNQMQMSSGASGAGIAQQISELEPLPMQPAEPPSVPTMKPMTPMQPMTMTMGDMSMSMGEMRMGDMSMGTQSGQSQASSSAGSRSVEDSPDATGQKRFCSQCGSAVGVGDRFCAQCGNKLA